MSSFNEDIIGWGFFIAKENMMAEKKIRKLHISQVMENKLLRKIVEITNSELGLEKVLKETVNIITEVTKADSVFIYLLDNTKKQIKEFKPEAVAVMENEKADLLKDLLKKGNIGIDVYSGIEGIIKVAKLSEADTVVNSLVGSIGVRPTIEAIKRTGRLPSVGIINDSVGLIVFSTSIYELLADQESFTCCSFFSNVL